MEFDIYTDGCAREISGDDGKSEYHAGWGWWGFDKDGGSELFSYGPIGKDGTNNQAELKAVIDAVTICTALGAKTINLFIDSLYVIKGCTVGITQWPKRGWMTKKQEPVKNLDYWKDYIQAKAKADKSNIKLVFNKVKGHSGNKGNDLADEYALKGAKLSRNGKDTIRYLSSFGKEDTRPAEKDAIITKKKSTKVPVKDSLIIGSRILTITGTEPFVADLGEEHGKFNVHYSFKYGKDKNVPDRELGVESADTAHCITFSKDEDFQVKAMRDKVHEDKELEVIKYPVVTYWDKLSSGNTRKLHYNDEIDFKSSRGTIYYLGEQKDPETKLMVTVKIPVTKVIKVSRRAWFTISDMENKYLDLFNFILGNLDKDNISDITDMFIIDETDKKGKVKRVPNPKIKGKNQLDVVFPNGIKHRLSSMIDMINPMSLGTIIKQHPTIRFYLAIHNENKVQFQYSFIASCETGHMLMNNPHTNTIYKKV